MPNLTPLETVAMFTDDVRKQLAAYWITSAEEFVSTARAGNRQLGTGLTAIAQTLNLPQDRVRGLVQAALAALPPGTSFDVGAELTLGTGAIFDGMEAPTETAFDLPLEDLPTEKTLTSGMPVPLQQGERNTCVAFTLVAMYQQMSGDALDLSEQFLYWACKERDGIPGDVGTRPDVAMKVLVDSGVCRESTWSYNPTLNPSNAGQGPPPAGASEEAQQRRIGSYLNLPPKDVRKLKALIAAGKSVLIGLPINEHWTNGWQSRTLGRVRKPLPGEATLGGHAMCAIGYRDDDSVPGGGYFIVRNSWGADWGKDNPDGAGYAHVPYRLIFESNLAAFAIDSIAPATQPVAGAAEAGTTSAAPVAGAAAAPAAGAAAPPMPDRNELQELYTQAQQLVAITLSNLGELNKLMVQMSALIYSMPSPSTAASAPLGPPSAPPAHATHAPDSPHHTVPFHPWHSEPAGPLILIGEIEDSTLERLHPNGIDATTGRPLLQIDAVAGSNIARTTNLSDPNEVALRQLHKAKVNAGADHFGPIFGVSEDKLEQSRWAVVVNAADDAAIIKALSPLIVKRCKDQGFPAPKLDFRSGERCGEWLQRHVADFDAPLKSNFPVMAYLPGESCTKWLARHKVTVGPVDPARGVPFYLLLAGRPGPLTANDAAFIPFEFQYELDIFWGVGRLCFTDLQTGQHNVQAYSAYAEQVVAFEQLAEPPYSKHVVYFGTRHDLDPSTERSANELVKALFQGQPNQKSIADRFGFTQQLLLAENATRANLDLVLCGNSEQGQPALLFTASHGIGFPADDPRLFAQQGALVCQDWTGFGSIKREHWYAAEDLTAQTKVNGSVVVCFACYGMGCPREDQFVFKSGQERPFIAPYPIVAQLPQQLLARGALAVLGHVDRAWTHSFSTTGVSSQTQSFESILLPLMAGKRFGFATDQFNMRQGAVSSQLADELEKVSFGRRIEPTDLSSLWVARNDARNYALLGDPAVRLPFSPI